MDVLDLSRWQFGITTVYHFLFVPLTIGLSVLVAGFQTAWHRTGDATYLRMTKFWGKLFLINFAMGVVTGIVQEFQFGMNWSAYSRFVGDVFGAPLAMEGLMAFFLESTFLGLWIFGWDKLPKRVHLATIWLAAIGTNLSAYFILAANSWMQHPVGYRLNPRTGRAELTDIWAVLTNVTTLAAFPHVVFGAFVTAGAFVAGVSVWQLARKREVALFRASARTALVVTLVASAGVMLSGHWQAQIMTEQQPMKMAAAEALWEDESSAGFSIFAVGDVENGRNHINIQIPYGLSLLATNTLDGKVEGINDIQARYEKTYGAGDYKPVVGLAYWSFRLMIGFGALAGLLALAGLWLTRRGRTPRGPWFHRIAVLGIGLPFLANTLGWIFTEMGRQPWTVFGIMRTAAAVSPGADVGEVAATLAGFTLVYAVLAVIEVRLLLKFIRKGPEPEDAVRRDDPALPALSY
ncbi:cytochrome ubiquinol oxidase subunit I [Microbispora rosea subsp. aerata]|nr:cytochrome ubiquinol oxidase subunit I [Microbispora rosea]GGO29638.1 cytochrome ubiquinol oxidase subunit I [Microbispora rosea subsp. aerata]GIH57662.1 cytochrome ubiquinol oxidase subunit I [Microbispora rosea subsp. aerata]GLJ85842.1 cytochrome ubiquinol oxidase subunit I [Microbispora rosea subsp. aerata]